MIETITGASTIAIDVQDSTGRALLRSQILQQESIVTLDGAGFTLAAIRKTGSGLTLTCEDVAVAALRKASSYRKVNPGQLSRAAFVADLVSRDTHWVTVRTTAGPASKVELARGKPKTATTDAEKESTWDAATRIMGEIGWRVFARRGELWVVPDSYLVARAPYKLTESTPGVISPIDFDWDVGKPAATATFTVAAAKTAMAAGSAVLMSGMGPANGTWIVEQITRTAGEKTAQVQCLRALPVLAEPKPAAAAAEGEDGWTPGLFGEFGEAGQIGTSGQLGHTGNLGLTDSIIDRFVTVALDQIGKKYVWGHSGPKDFDCSGLVQYCADKVGLVGVGKPVAHLLAVCEHRGKVVSVEAAQRTRGALLLRVGRGGTNHVAISLGNGTTMEAMGRAYGCRIGRATGRPWTHGGLLPGLFDFTRPS